MATGSSLNDEVGLDSKSDINGNTQYLLNLMNLMEVDEAVNIPLSDIARKEYTFDPTLPTCPTLVDF